MPTITRFWLIRHALVAENARTRIYGNTDVPICEPTMAAQGDAYAELGRRLPRPAHWLITPLSRTRRTAEAIFRAGYPAAPLEVEPDMIEQSFGDWHGLVHADVPARLSMPAHPFWSHGGAEQPPGGESVTHVRARVGAVLERLADARPGQDVVSVSHGGTIRAAVAHVLDLTPHATLSLSVQNISLTVLERVGGDWRVVCVNSGVSDFL